MSFRSFLYEDFDQAAPAAIGALNGASAMPEPGPRPYREIDIVRRESFEAGRAHGRAEGRQAALEEAEAQLARDLPDLLASLGGAAADLARAKRACERDAARLAAAAVRQILPLVAEGGLGREIAALVADVVANVPGPEIEVRAAPHTLDAITRRCGSLPPAVALKSDASLPEGGIRCRWNHGEARFDGAAVTEAVLAILDRCLRESDDAPAPALENAGQQKEE